MKTEITPFILLDAHLRRLVKIYYLLFIAGRDIQLELSKVKIVKILEGSK